jgi:hypothetical protein
MMADQVMTTAATEAIRIAEKWLPKAKWERQKELALEIVAAIELCEAELADDSRQTPSRTVSIIDSERSPIMGSTWQDLLNELMTARNADYRDDVERRQSRFDSLEYVVITMLEKLRDAERASSSSSSSSR